MHTTLRLHAERSPLALSIRSATARAYTLCLSRTDDHDAAPSGLTNILPLGHFACMRSTAVARSHVAAQSCAAEDERQYAALRTRDISQCTIRVACILYTKHPYTHVANCRDN